MKKIIYIISFAIFGFLAQLLVHAGTEMAYINLLLRDFDTYGFGLSWNAWFAIHAIGTVLLTIAGVSVGIWQGFYWWRRIYERP